MKSAPIAKKPTQVELAKLLNSREFRLYEIRSEDGLSTVAAVLDAKRGNQKVYVLSVMT